MKSCIVSKPKRCFIAVVLLWSAAAAPVLAQSTTAILLEHVRVIAGDGTVLDDTSLLIDAGLIAAVGNQNTMNLPSQLQRLDLRGKTVMPALIDTHAHLGYENFSSWGASNYSIDTLKAHLARYAFYGFSAVFSAGSDPDVLALQLQSMQRNGEVGGARFLFAAGMGPPGQGPNNQFLVEALAVEDVYGYTILRGLGSVEQALEAVRSVALLNIPYIKIWVDDRGGSQEKLSPEIYRALIDEADRFNIAVLVHQQTAMDMPDLIDAGVAGFLHGRMESGFTADIAAAASTADAFIVPNLGLAELRREAIGEDPFLSQSLPETAIRRLSESAQRQLSPAINIAQEQALASSFATALQAGVKLVLGTDAGAVPDHPFGYTGHRELEIFVRLGMSPMQAIAAGTSVAAAALGLEDTGLLKPGYRADLLVLNENPLENIRHTREIYQVYLGGELQDRQALRAMFSDVADASVNPASR